MNRPRRLLYLLVPLAVWAIAWALPGRAQTPPANARFAFADTTLLRDTLGLRFDELFPLADSLGVTPDTLRALAIRYRYPLRRIVMLADSMHVPVDSVGPTLERERFNPLAAGKRVNTLRYTSGYDVEQSSSVWTNGSDYNFARGSIFVRNTTDISQDRFGSGGSSSLRETRNSVTETGWKLSPNFSIGGRANLERFNSTDVGSIGDQSETKNEFQLSLRSKQQPSRSFTSELNFFTGFLDLTNFQQIKRGLSNDLNGRLRIERGNWFTNDLTGQVTGNLARTGLPASPDRVNTHDLSNNIRGSLGLFTPRPVSANVNYQLHRSTVENPLAVTDTIRTPADTTFEPHTRAQKVVTVNNGVDGTLQFRQTNDRKFDVNAHVTVSSQDNGTVLNGRSSHRDTGWGADGRYLWQGWTGEGHFSYGVVRDEFPSRSLTGGYGDRASTASADGRLSRGFGVRFVLQASGRVSLTRSKYYLIGFYSNPPIDNDQYQQNYRLEGLYTVSDALNSALALDVTRVLALNLASVSSSSNNETDTYRAEWRWTYRLLAGLTATQRNALSANYLKYNYLQSSNRLSLDYSTVTTLNAVLSPRLTIDITHNADFQPSGSYGPLPDGVTYLSRSDETRNYQLRANISYTPIPGLSLLLSPEYLANNRSSAQNGVLAPQQLGKTMDFSGGASLNVPVGARARLTGNILRTFRDDRSVQYSSTGLASPSPRTSVDFWNGSLNLSWDLGK